jgi:CubicO group peptidase (beta-lactamase class C family)
VVYTFKRTERHISVKEIKTINPEKLKKAVQVLEHDRQQRWIPGYEAIVIYQGKKVLHTFGGFSEDGQFGQRPLKKGALFDMASLTKVMATTTAILILLEHGEIRLNDRVAYFIPEFGSRGKQEITIRHLLTHTSGLVAHRDFYSHGWSREEILAQIYQQDLIYQPDTRMVYSDLGFITLGELISKVVGLPFDRFVSEYIFKPLKMTDTSYLPTRDKDQIVATEYREQLGRYQCGEVNDDNAWALGGVAGHAGLFSTAEDTARFAQLWLNEGTLDGSAFLSPLTVHLATRSHTSAIPGANRGLGWVLKGDEWDASGDLSSSSSFGHTGFTGTSILIDPTYQLGIVLLTNRVHYSRELHIARTRARFHNMVYASLEG